MRSGWAPILTGALQDRALETVCALASAVREPSPSPSLARGEAGLALLHRYVAAALPSAEHEAAAESALDRLLERASESAELASLYRGFTGLAWTLAHLERQLGAGADTSEIDDLLQEQLRESPWRGEFDLVEGLVGFGVYALERLPDPAGVKLLAAISAHLSALAERDAEGIFWRPPPDGGGGGALQAGVAHGAAGVVALLAGAGEHTLLPGAVAWLLSQRLPDRVGRTFPAGRREPGAAPAAARSAWCIGDPGIAVALLHAARSARVPQWEEVALQLARDAAAVPVGETGVTEAGLCHGAAGLAHLYNRLFQATGADPFRKAAIAWFEVTLGFRQPSGGLAGYHFPEGKLPPTGLLTGAAGVALALLGGATALEPAWDRFLLLSLPPAP